MSLRLVFVTAAVLAPLAVAPSVASAASATLVRVTGQGAKRVLVPTDRTVRTFGGQTMSVVCEEVGRPAAGGVGPLASHSGRVAIARRARFRVRATDDVCAIVVARRGRHTTQSIAVSEDGAVHLRRVSAVRRVYGLASSLPLAFGEELPSAEELVARYPDLYQVALPTPDGTVPASSTGVWTDEHQRVHIATALADGTQIYYDVDAATQVVSTNAFPELVAVIVEGDLT